MMEKMAKERGAKLFATDMRWRYWVNFWNDILFESLKMKMKNSQWIMKIQTQFRFQVLYRQWSDDSSGRMLHVGSEYDYPHWRKFNHAKIPNRSSGSSLAGLNTSSSLSPNLINLIVYIISKMTFFTIRKTEMKINIKKMYISNLRTIVPNRFTLTKPCIKLDLVLRIYR